MCRGLVGERAEVVDGSVLSKEGGDSVSWASEGCSKMLGGDSLRFLYEDVLNVIGPISVKEIRLLGK